MFATGTVTASGITEAISAVADAMPWNSIAKVIVAWINAKKERQIFITLEGEKVFYAKGYPVEEIKKLLPNATVLTVIEPTSSEKA